MEKSFFEVLSGLDFTGSHLMLTVVSGPEAGERMIMSGGKCVYGIPGGFASGRAADFAGLEGIGVTEDAGREIYYEQVQGRPQLVICGAGHVGLALAGVCTRLKYAVTVIEDRPAFADMARKTGADRVICDDFEHALSGLAGSPETYFVIMTRGHRFDLVCLRAILKKPHAYIGLMSSRGRAAVIRQNLLAEGVSESAAEALHMPIGLKIGSETPEEIAVSVAAELIQVHHAGRRRAQMPGEIVKAVLDPAAAGKTWVLATIIRRVGSGPRDAGAKMLLDAAGPVAGTIGGGCAEAEVIRLAREMLLTDGPCCRRHKIDLRYDDTHDTDGMACGGQVEVFLEVVS